MSAERMIAYSDDSNPKAEIDPALRDAVEEVYDTMPDKVDFPTSAVELEPSEESETLTADDKSNVYDRVGRLMNRLSEGAADRKEARSALKAKLIGFGKSALRITGKTAVVVANAPFIAADRAAEYVDRGIQKAADFTDNTVRTVGGELKYVASELGADARVAASEVKESYQNVKANVVETYQDTKESAKKFFKERAQNAKDRKNARLAKISGGFNRIKNNVGEKVTEANRRRRALGARAVAIVDRARTAKDAAKSAWNETGEETSLY